MTRDVDLAATVVPHGRVIVGALLLAIAVGGCLGSSQPASFYTLSAAARASGEAPLPQLALIVGPVTLPEYLDRPQIVTRRGANRLYIDEFSRWAGSLEGEVLRTVSADLSRLLGTSRVTTYPQEDSGASHRVVIDLSRFDGVPGEQVVLDARWMIQGLNPPATLAQRHTRISERVEGDDTERLVAAQSRLLGRLSEEIARTLRSLVGSAE